MDLIQKFMSVMGMAESGIGTFIPERHWEMKSIPGVPHTTGLLVNVDTPVQGFPILLPHFMPGRQRIIYNGPPLFAFNTGWGGGLLLPLIYIDILREAGTF